MHSISTKLGSALLVSILLFFLVSITFSSQQLNHTYNSILSIAAHTQLAQLSGSGSGLVAHYTFDEGSGTTAGDSAGSNTGTLVNGSVWGSGRIGGGIQFDGVNDWVTVPSPSSALINMPAMSISVWVKPSAFDVCENYNVSVVEKQNTNHGWHLGCQSSGYFRFRAWTEDSGGTSMIVNTTNPLSLNVWTHLTFTWDGNVNGSNAKLYVNGVESTSLSQVGTGIRNNDSSLPLNIGHNYYTGSASGYFKGILDDVRIYSRSLTPTEVGELYSYTGGSTTPTPVSGSCGSTTVNQCTTGSLTDTGDTSTTYQWQCTGSNGGSTASCSLPIPPPSSDTTPPTISSIQSSSLTTTGATITWTTNESSDTQIEYGLTTSYGSNTTLNTSLVTSHTQSLTGLTANTTYHYRVKSKDAANNLTTSSDQTFTTTSPVVSVTSGTYYVDFDSGNDANSGAIASPWKHAPGDANATGNARTVTLKPGDVVQFKGGVRYEGKIEIRQSGTAANPIIYKGEGWGSGKALLDGSVSFTNTWSRCTNIGSCYGNPNWQNIWYADSQFPEQTALNTVITGDKFLPFAQDVNPEAPIYFDTVTTWRKTPSQNLTADTIIDSSFFTQSDVNFWNGSYIAIHKSPNAVVIRKIVSFDPVTDKITAQSQTGTDFYNPTPYAILGHPLHIDYEGEYGLVGGRMYLWPSGNVNPASLSIRIGKLPQAILIAGQSYVTVEGFKIQGYYGSETDVYYSGGGIGNTGSGSYYNISILNNDISLVRSITAGPVLGLGHVTNGLVSGNTIKDSLRSRGFIGNGSNIDVVDNSWERLSGTGIYFAGVTNGSIRNNKIIGLRGTHGNGISVYQGSSNITVDSNYLRENGSPITYERSSDLTFTNNFVEASYGGVDEWGGMSGYVKWFNNTIVNHSLHFALNVDRTGTAKYELRNNIFDGASWQDEADVIRSNNIWLGRSMSYPAPILGVGEVLNTNLSAIFIDPSNGDYRLKSTSPALNAGANLSPLFTTDIEGNPRGTTWDIGAYEYTGASTPISGSCSTTLNTCTTGTFSDTTDTSSNSLWSCTGSGGGTTASCSLPIVLDTTSPTITLTSPSGTISSTVTLSATASDNIGVTSVQFLIDGSLISTLTTAPYSGTWNTTGILDGTHTLTATARDAAGNTRTSNPVTITVNNNTAPVLASIGSKSVTTGTPLTFTILATDAQTANLTYTTGILPQGASFSNRVFTWTPSSVGTYTTRFTVTDGSLSDFEDVTITVTAPLPVDQDSDGDGVANATDKCPLTPLSLRSEVNIYGCPKPKTTKFTLVPNPATTDISTSLSSLEISNAYGKVTYATPVVLYRDQTTYKGQLDIDTNMNISGSTISLTSSSLPELNKTATISLYNIGYSSPRIMKDGILCTTCTFVSYTNGTYTFRVTGFSTYTVEETPSTTSTPSTGGGGSSTGTFTPTVTQVAVGGGSISTSTSSTSPYTGLSLLLRNLYRGITGEDVRTLQRFLVIEGLLTIDIPTTYFGILTETAVKAFQSRNSIVSTGDPYTTGYGSVGPKTRSVINAKIGNTSTAPVITSPSTINVPITQTLTYDMTDPQVTTLQTYLISKGYLTSQPTGYFGSLTLAAVKKLQCEKLSICSGTPESNGYGAVGPRTRAALQ